VIGDFFGIAKGSIEWQIIRTRTTSKNNDRPRTLPQEAYSHTLNIVQAQFAEQKPVTHQQLQDAIEWYFQISKPTDTFRYICRGMPGLKRVVGPPMERFHVHCDQSATPAFYDELKAVIEDIPAEFGYYIDESGCSEWADEPVEMVVRVLADFEGDRVFVPFDRHSK
jgi:hypothetical protein